ncbi:DUF1990 family protein [Rhodococcoides kroppenstedtii]|uniref:DUF1990 family protein n=1 Tax=Rhodococcoides kroppenstedtii TaxID=293050 RepID=UPI00169311EE|nr:DUF1990 domain-containing protein [Rhodococcus kroppenstedtii]NIL79065.1 hypothetical protein [Rhodococcus kroppenstedtii]
MALRPSADPASYRAAPLTYPEVGGTASESMPSAGYHHVRESRPLGRGVELFDEAARRLLRWDMHRGAGLAVRATAVEAEPDAIVVLGLGPIRIPCRVVDVIDDRTDARRERGFAYGTLPGHPERGEERFVVRYDERTGAVSAHIRAFSTAGNAVVALGGPLNRLVQRVATRRYLDALVTTESRP